MKCPFCSGKEDEKKDIQDFDETKYHAILVMREDGAIHIHAPFGNADITHKMIETFIIEAEKNGIIYRPRV